MNETDFKYIMLARYCGEFRPADKTNVTIRKTSDDIRFDLQELVEVSTNEIAEFLIRSGYGIDFVDGKPVWMMREPQNLEIEA